ncbi:hypothetical protein AB0K12_20070 [Nonomuraea sp. NPDC049419]
MTITGLRSAFQVKASVEEAIQTLQAPPQLQSPQSPTATEAGE